jgi:hypothetical protein
MSPNKGEGGVAGSQPMSTAVHRSPNKIWRSKSIFKPWSWPIIQKPNSSTYNFVEVSGHNLESSPTWSFRIQCLHYKSVSNHFGSLGEGSKICKEVTVNGKKETLKTFVPITAKNSASGLSYRGIFLGCQYTWSPLEWREVLCLSCRLEGDWPYRRV